VAVTDPRARDGDTAARLRDVPGLDVDAGLAFVGNSLDVYIRLLNRFVQLHERDVHEMVRQAERADHDSVQRLAHAIKGGAATLGLSAVADLASRLEEAACGNPSDSQLIELAKALEADHAALSGNLARACTPRAAPRGLDADGRIA
jgi:HPt (histidine-containing phosphotransfer) domain-containing protein